MILGSRDTKASIMAFKSKAKGKVGELEVAELFRRHGFQARRGQQFSGSPDSPDVVHDMAGFHVEVKRTERFDMWKALDQANRDKAPEEIATVFHRKNARDWVVVLSADEFLMLMAKYVFEEGAE